MTPTRLTRTSPHHCRAHVAVAAWYGITLSVTAHAQPASTGSGQAYPARAVRLVVASSPGSGVDIVARIMAQRMSETLGAQMVVDNRPGAGGLLGVQSVAKAAPDGYTLLMAAPSFTIAASMNRDLPYDTLRDFAPVGQATTGHYIVVVHPSVPVQSLKELIALAKARPGQLNYGAGGIGGSTHLAAEYFKSMTGVNIVVVPYKGSGAAVTDLIAGQIHLMFANISAAMPHVRTGKLRALAATGSERSLALPQLPTVAEAGVPGYAVTSWFGLAAPARTPPEVIAKLNAVLTTAMNGRDMRERLAVEGAEPAPGTSAEFGRHIAREIGIWAKVVKVAGL
jgi:tripartite-type tricarboxylate transporter receptor subunit TctC